MYERAYGYRYAEVAKYATCAEIAKAIRSNIKQAQEEGLLPTRWSYSVRSDAISVDVEVRDCPDAWEPCDGMNCHDVWCAAKNDPAYARGAQPHQVLTEEAAVARLTLKRIHDAYNHDGSEIQTDYFDVRYYGVVEFESESSAEFRRQEKERLEQKRSARAAGEIVGKVANYGRDLRGGQLPVVHVVVKLGDGREVLACGARVSRYGFQKRLAEDAAVTCSRCAKRAES